MNFVDLAGSERQKKTGATGLRLEEANSNLIQILIYFKLIQNFLF